MTGRGRAGVALLGWMALLAGTLWALHGLGTGALAPPPSSGGASALGEWLERRGAAAAAFSLLRLVALGLGWYLLAVAALALAARVLRAPAALTTMLERFNPAPVRQLIRAAAGVSLAAVAAVSATASPLTAAASPGAVTMRRLPDAPVLSDAPHRRADAEDGQVMARLPDVPASARRPSPVEPDQLASPTWRPIVVSPAEAPVVMRRLPDVPEPASSESPMAAPEDAATLLEQPTSGDSGAPSAAGNPAVPPAVGVDPPLELGSIAPDARQSDPSDAAAARQAGPGRMTSGVGSTWTVGAGDHFWHIAEATLSEAWGRPPSEREIADFWRRLVDRNRARLPDPTNPDLLFPGHVIDVPALQPASEDGAA